MTSRPALDRLAAMIRAHKIPLATVEKIIAEEQQRIATLAHHEAGHAVAAVVLGGQLRDVTISGDAGRTTVEPDTFPRGREAPIAYAGPWAQARHVAGRRPTLRQVYAAMECHTPATDGGVLCASGGTAAGADVVPLLERCWEAVEAVARTLNRFGRASHADVCSALKLSRDPETRAVELALIRSGRAPGTFRVTPPPR